MGALSDYIGKPAFESALLHVVDEKVSGTSGGTAPSSSTFFNRQLNTVRQNQIAGATLSANVITLPAGRYFISASAPALSSLPHKIRIFNATAASVIFSGTSEFAASSYQGQTRSFASGVASLAVPTDILVQHFFNRGLDSGNLGQSTASGEPEVYTDLKIWRLGDI
ncbi:MAG: hypothetical protein CME80_08495 [Halomonas sp.]|nr:hypothetical protein [Halomonas sp.]MBF57743.1 hypothetical protein [Halomonas sp.]|tara:strand:+ start:36268 stop:36768 length:501 start_codon:yes stop_codon:yes gene_type:complete